MYSFCLNYLTFNCLLTLVLLCPSSLFAETHSDQDEEVLIEEIVVYGRSLAQKGSSKSASEGLVGYSDFSTRPIERVGEFVEVVPGMVATQHSGEGKANQYFLRGMNLDHGTDFSVFFMGMPINMRAHAHGQGYLDLNFLIPEIISTVRFAKGPYRADRGDFSTAGTTTFNIYEEVDSPYIKVEFGSDNYVRSLAVGSLDFNKGAMLSALEVMKNDGPWVLPADVDKVNFLTQYTLDLKETEIKTALTVYENNWNSTDQIPQRQVLSGAMGRFGYVDPSLGGDSSRLNMVFGLSNDSYSAGLYVSRYKLNLFGNSTYFQEDPVDGDSHEQVDRRWIYGGHFELRRELTSRVNLRVGTDLRSDQIGEVSLHSVENRIRLKLVRQDSVDWLSLGVFAELEIDISDKLRGLFGVRTDYSDYDVLSNLSDNSGRGSDDIWLPSIGFAYEVGSFGEVYLNWGKGFHSNDVRGATIAFDPLSNNELEPVALFSGQDGAEVGYRIERGDDLLLSLTYFWLQSDSELIFAGDSGGTEASDGSERSGLELALFWELDNNWVVDVSGSFTDSEFVGVDSRFNHIPNAHGRVISMGLTRAPLLGWNWSLRVRHFGDAALVEDDSVNYPSTTVVNTGISYKTDQWTVGVDLFNLADSEDYDIAYWYSSRLMSEVLPVEDIHFHPVNPRSIRVSLEYRF
ncbi:MAG: TonB-dependent receptor [Candidatus Azotimanducaceae bacterium]